MTSHISKSLLSELSEFVSTRMGLHFPVERRDDLERGIVSACSEFGSKDVESCIKWLVNSPLTKQEFEILASHLTIGETYFFRDKKIFDILNHQILPELIMSRRKNEKCLRIWSAGCATGEEPYSIAILLRRMIPDIEDWNITILATDINPNFLRKAQKGIYDNWSFRDEPSWIWNYFKKTSQGFELIPEIRKMVVFSYHNLAEDPYPSLLNNTAAMDIIFCRNVLMYFSRNRAEHVVSSLYLSLVEDGWLAVSAVETSHLLFHQYSPVNFPGTIIYRKEPGKTQEIKVPQKIPVREIRDVREVPKKPLIQIKKEKKMPVPVVRMQEKTKSLYEEASDLYEKGNYAGAIEQLLTKVKQDPDTKAMILLSRAYANSGKTQEAQNWCEKAIGINKLEPGYHYLHAMILQERGQIEEAVRSLKRTLYLDHDFVLAHFGLGNLCKQQRKFNESDKHFDNALILLKKYNRDEILAGTEGITAGRLSEIINSIKGRETLNEREFK